MIYFEVVPASGGYRAHVRSKENGQLIWWTEVYTRKPAAFAAIKALQVYAATAPVYDRAAAA